MPEDITQTHVDIIQFLRDKSDWVSTKALAGHFKLTTPSVNESLRELLRWGYRFDTNHRGEVKFLSAPDILFAHEICRGLKTQVLGKTIYCFRSAGSTNTLAQRYAIKGAPDGTVIVAGKQTAGRGRLGRTWISPPKVGIYMSVILRPDITPAQAPGLSLVAALAVAEAIREYPQLTATIKWPNDVLISGRKVAGVLTELSAELDHVLFVIVGIGINANHQKQDFPDTLADKATSLRIACGDVVDRSAVVRNVLHHLEKRYLQFVKHGLKDQIKAIKDASSILSHTINFQQDGKTAHGTAVDIDTDGALIVTSGKRTIRLLSGEITLKENY